MLESRLASTPHISENRLSKMPPEELIWWSLRIIKKSLIKMFSSNSIIIKAKVYNFMTVLTIGLSVYMSIVQPARDTNTPLYFFLKLSHHRLVKPSLLLLIDLELVLAHPINNAIDLG